MATKKRSEVTPPQTEVTDALKASILAVISMLTEQIYDVKKSMPTSTVVRNTLLRLVGFVERHIGDIETISMDRARPVFYESDGSQRHKIQIELSYGSKIYLDYTVLADTLSKREIALVEIEKWSGYVPGVDSRDRIRFHLRNADSDLLKQIFISVDAMLKDDALIRALAASGSSGDN